MWLFLAAVAFGGETAPVDLSMEADLHFRRGIEAYRAGNWDAALEHLLASNRLVPNRAVAFNLARTFEQIGNYAEAYRYYADYVALEPDPGRRAPAETALSQLAAKVALVALTSEPPGATIYVDRQDLGARGVTPQTLALPAGAHTVQLARDGYAPVEQQVNMTLGQRVEVRAALEAIVGTVDISGTAGAEVRLGGDDGPLLGALPGAFRVAPGPQVLVVKAPGYADRRLIVEVKENTTVRQVAELDLLTGQVVVNALERDALIAVDGVAAGFTPAVIDVPVGGHVLTVTRAGFRTFEQEIRVIEGGSLTVDVRLRSVQEVNAASRATQTVEEAPASVSVVTAAEIRAFGYQSVYDALAATRGVFQTNDLTYTFLGVRGFGRPGDYGNRVLMTWDGHTLNDDQLGASYVSEDLAADLSDVDRIELVRGPGSALYGSNAFFGVINVVPHAVATGVRATLTGDAESRVRASATGGTGDADRGVYLTLGGTEAQGRDYTFPERADRATGPESVDADTSRSGHLHLRGWSGDWTFHGTLNARTKQIPSGAYGTVLGSPAAHADDVRTFGEVRFDPKISEKTDLGLRAWVDAYGYDGDFPYGAGYLYSDRWRGVWTGFEPRVLVRPVDALSLTVGAEARVNPVAELTSSDNEGATFLDESPTQTVLSAYALGELHLGDKVTFDAGGRFDWFSLADIGGTANPRAALILEPGPADVIKLMGGTAFRAPSPYELFYSDGGITQVPADGLTPERIATGELEVDHRLGEATVLSGSAFYNRISDLVDTALTDGPGSTFQYVNTGEPVQVAGAEAEIRQDWRQGTTVAWQHSFAHARVGDLIDGALLTNSPNYQTALKAAAPLVPGVSTVATRVRVGAPRQTTEATWTRWSVLWDVMLSGDLPSVPVAYGLGVRNLLDWEEEHPGGFDLPSPAVPQPGRSFYASLTARK